MPMDTRLIIPLEDFPITGRQLSGEIDGAIFDIDDEDTKNVAPLGYKLSSTLFDNELVAQGSVWSTFSFRCARCLERFEYSIERDDVTIVQDVAAKLDADISEEMREELLVALPNYPKCELAGIECEINVEFSDFGLDKDPQTGVNSATPSDNSVWDALNNYSKQ